MTACRVMHPALGPCIVAGPHGTAARPHRYSNVSPTPTAYAAPYSGPYVLVERNGALGTAHLLGARVATLDDARAIADHRVLGSRAFHTVTVHPAAGSVETATAVYTARGAY